MFEFTTPAGSAPQSPRSLAASVAVHGLAVFLLLALRFSGTISNLPVAKRRVTLLAPVKEIALTVPKPRMPLPARQFQPTPPTPARLEVPIALLIPAPAIEISKVLLPEIPKAPEKAAAIQPSGFTEATPARAPTVAAHKPVIKTSGFENAEKPAAGLVRGASSAIGSFDSAHAAEGVPDHNTNRAMQRSGFSDAAASSSGSARGGSITSGGFGDSTFGKGIAVSRPASSAVTSTPVEIVSKPKPAYTDEARAKNIEGEVLLEIEFGGGGEVRVLRVVRGLGHGLDETALAAARGIRFRPATRDGGAVNSVAIVHILFQLAQ